MSKQQQHRHDFGSNNMHGAGIKHAMNRAQNTPQPVNRSRSGQPQNGAGGAIGGAVVGAVVGGALGGPAGSVLGALIGGFFSK